MKLELTKFKAPLLNIICTLLILLWVYTAGSKLADVQEFKHQLGNQTFGKTVAALLFWFIPISELFAAFFLLFNKTRLAGLILSFGLMFLFTSYVGLVLSGYYNRTPCSCGGVLRQMGWHMHFWFNVYFLGISGLGVWLEWTARKITEKITD